MEEPPMQLSELVSKTRLPGEYITYLKGIIDGTETDYARDDAEIAEELEDQLTSLVLEEDDQGGW
jgi:hypothetical protein